MEEADEDANPLILRARLEETCRLFHTSVNNTSISWRCWGDGRPLILIHGGSGSWTHWLKNISYLSRKFLVCTVDLPAHGGSSAMGPPFSIENMSNMLRSGIDEIVPDLQFDVAAFSFGSIVAAQLAAMVGPQRLGQLILVGPARFGSAGTVRSHLINWRQASDQLQFESMHRHNLEVLMLHDHSKIDESTIEIQADNARNTRISVRKLEGMNSIAENLAIAKVPLAGIWGEHDALTRNREEDRVHLAKLSPGAEFVVVKGAGHWVQYECPDVFNRELVRILQRQDGC
jgi:2-hydroxy-6-oxonona-2,4-dienedioate hydrolase